MTTTADKATHTCGCGAELSSTRATDIQRHEKSQAHQTWVEQDTQREDDMPSTPAPVARLIIPELPKDLMAAVRATRATPQQRAKMVRHAYADNPDLQTTYGSVRAFCEGHGIPVVDTRPPTIF